MDINDRILDKLEKIDEAIQETKLEIVQIKGDVAYHIQRTDLAEENTANIKKETDARLNKLEKWSDKFHYLGWALFAVLGLLQKLEPLKAFLHSFF